MAVEPRDPRQLAFGTQPTLSMDHTVDIISALKGRFPHIVGPHGRDICYATTNRQEAIKALSPKCDLVLVVGSATSSNSQRLVEVAVKAGARDAKLVDDASRIDPAWFDGIRVVGLTAGASAPEVLVEGVLAWLAVRYELSIEVEETARETVTFKLPRVLTEERVPA